MTATIEGIEAQLRSYNPHADTNELEEAYVFAAEKHAGQTRKSGEPFINHPLEVAMILASLHLDTATLQAALLHDVVEDSGVTRQGDSASASVRKWRLLSMGSPSWAASSSRRLPKRRPTTCARC